MNLYEGTTMGNPAAYAGSKGGLIQLTKWLATSLAPEIRVNCVSPGGLARGQAPEFIEKYVAKTPLKRMGTEEDFMGVIAFLASDLSAWVTGQNIMVDGGWTTW
jgi:NAD(P)-dependent dehydrogenase (short-subunit alcohol dehydrogenase family)